MPRSASSVTLNGSHAPSCAAGQDEVVARAAERDRQLEPIEPGQHVVEPVAVLEREHPREVVLAAVEVVERGLHADQVAVAGAEGVHRPLS